MWWELDADKPRGQGSLVEAVRAQWGDLEWRENELDYPGSSEWSDPTLLERLCRANGRIRQFEESNGVMRFPIESHDCTTIICICNLDVNDRCNIESGELQFSKKIPSHPRT